MRAAGYASRIAVSARSWSLISTLHTFRRAEMFTRKVVLIITLLFLFAGCTAQDESTGLAESELDLSRPLDEATAAAGQIILEDGAGFGAQDMTLSALSVPAVVLTGEFVAATASELDGIVEVTLEVQRTIFVDEQRKDLSAPASGTLRAWGTSYVLLGDASVGDLDKELSGSEVAVLLGYHDDAGPLPQQWEVMALASIHDGSVTFVGPHATSLNGSMTKALATTGSSGLDTLNALAEELAARDSALASGGAEADVIGPILEALRPVQLPTWLDLEATQRDVLDAPDDVVADLDERTVIVEFEPGLRAEGYVLGLLSEAGWTGATTLDADYALIVPALIQPGSDLLITVARDTIGLDDMVVIATIGSRTWESAAAIHVYITQEVLDLAIDGGKDVDGLVAVNTLATAAEMRELRTRLSERAEANSVVSPPGLDESEDEQDPNEFDPPSDG
jgi:hypothetical protein